MTRAVPLLSFALLVASQPAHADTWTVLAYIAGDNDLEKYVPQNVTEMTKVGTGANLTVVAQVDRGLKHSQDAIPGVANFLGARRLLVKKDTVELLADLGHPDATQPETIAAFIDWGIRTYPADHYALVMWDHGGGWKGANQDELGGRHLTPLADLVGGIQQGLMRAGKPKFDLIGWDECLMANLEVADALVPYGDVLVASEEEEPGEGWDYEVWLSAIVQNPSIDAAAVGRAIADGFANNVANRSKDPKFTLSVVKLDQLAALTNSLGELANGLAPLAGQRDTWLAVARARSKSDGFGRKGQNDPHGLIDLGMLAAAIGETVPSLKTQADAVKAALSNAVLYNKVGPSHAGSTGLTLYLPERAFDTEYSSIAFSSKNKWGGFVAAYAVVSQTDDVGPAMAAVGPGPMMAMGMAGGRSLQATTSTTDTDVADVAVIAARDDGAGGRTLLGALPVEMPAGGGEITGTWSGNVYRIGDGTAEADVAFFPIDRYEEGGQQLVLLAAPAELNVDGEYEPGTLLFAFSVATQTGRFVGAFEQLEGEGAGEVPLGNTTDRVRPMVVKVKDTGDYELKPGTAEISGVNLTLVAKPMETMQQISVGFRATDLAGNDTTTLASAETLASGKSCGCSTAGAAPLLGVLLALKLRRRRAQTAR